LHKHFQTKYRFMMPPAPYLLRTCCVTGCVLLVFQKCDAGFLRQKSGRFLGQCLACQCNGHSNDCDPRTGACLVRNSHQYS